MSRYGLAMLIIGGAGLVAGTSRSGADVIESQTNHECWMQATYVCSNLYFGPCENKPEGTSCFTCPYTLLGTAFCKPRTNFTCQPTSELPFDCGPQVLGMCLAGECYGEVIGTESCTVRQCSSGTP